MTEFENEQSNPYAPYNSREAREQFNKRAIILAVVAGLVMFMMPVAIGFFMMFSMMKNTFAMNYTNVARSCFLKGKIYYVTGHLTQKNVSKKTTIFSYDPVSREEPVKVVELNTESKNVHLLTFEDEILAVTPRTLFRIKDGQISNQVDYDRLKIIESLFVYQGKPALFEKSKRKYSLKTFNGKKWDSVREFSFSDDSDENGNHLTRKLYGGEYKDRFVLVMFYGGELFYREGLPDESEQVENWKKVSSSSGDASLLTTDNNLYLFYLELQKSGNRPPRFDVVGMDFKGDAFEQFYKAPYEAMITGFAVFPAEGSRNFTILTQFFPGGFLQNELKGDKLERVKQIGKTFPFPNHFFLFIIAANVIVLIIPLMLAKALSRSMDESKSAVMILEDKRVVLASLWKRSLAKGIDMGIFMIPFMIPYIYIFANFDRIFSIMLTPQYPFMMFGMIFLFWGGAIFALLLISYLEGKFGKTPGKWIMRIRVINKNLEYCGMLKGFLRNILLIVDAMFNYLVGILLIAFNDERQRVGDLAANTVVIDDDKNPELIGRDL